MTSRLILNRGRRPSGEPSYGARGSRRGMVADTVASAVPLLGFVALALMVLGTRRPGNWSLFGVALFALAFGLALFMILTRAS